MGGGFLEEVSRRSGQSFNGCYQCLSCGGGCPVVEAMDYNPNQLIRMVQRGMREQVLCSRAIWVCVGCFSCLSQCPNRVHIPAMMDVLREMALESGVRVGEPGIMAFHRAFLGEVRRWGRVYELGLMMRYKLATRRFLEDLGVGLKMMGKRKLELLPSRVRDVAQVRRLMTGGSA